MALENSVINNNVYLIVNDIAKQALGSINIDVVDTKSFVDFGNAVINSSDYTETFMQTLLLRIARTYETWRPYESSLRDLVISGEEWGAIYQKIDAEVPDFVSDETFELVDGTARVAKQIAVTAHAQYLAVQLSQRKRACAHNDGNAVVLTKANGK